MSSVLLFSELTKTNEDDILSILFAGETKGKTFAYMPSGGVRGSESYVAAWADIAAKHNANFVAIDNTSSQPEERDKLLGSDTLLISGGNTFQLLHNLRTSGLDKVIIEFSHKQDVLLAGFSAGALVLTPTIKICSLPGFDENLVGFQDFDGLGIVDFEVFPHYEKSLHENILSGYRKTASNRVRELTNKEHILVNL